MIATILIDRNHPIHVLITKILKHTQTSLENRLRSIKKYIHQLWSTIFNTTNAIETKLIIGITHRKKYQIRTCSHLSAFITHYFT
jgi:hypothetical protein